MLCWAAAATGQASATPPVDREAIVVTGERVTRSLKDTASSVSVVTSSDIDARSANRIDELLAAIPNVQLGNGSEAPAIRGQDTTGVLQALDAFLGGARPRATTEVDGRAVGFQEYVFGTAPVWDIKQVEVFRSPLTVTHGRNSIAGGIVITSNDPTYHWEGRVRAIGGNYDTREASGVISGPLIDDQLAFRLAGDIRHARTTSELGRNMRGADPNDDDYSLVRLKLLAEPRALSGFRLVGTYTHTYSRMPQVVTAIQPFRERRDPTADYGIFGVRVDAATLHAARQFDNGAIEMIVSAGHSHSRRFAPPGFGEAEINLDDVSAEMFGNWNIAPDLTLRGGAHRLTSRLRQYIDLSQFIFSEGRFRDRQHSFGMFGEAELALTDRLTMSAGGRYQQDRQRRVGGLSGLVNVPIDLDARFSAWLPKISLSYAVTPALNAGVLIQRAYNPGGATLALDTGETDTFKDESLWDYEAFLKGTVPRLRLTVAANLFYNDMKDAQQLVIIPFTTPGGGHDFYARFNNVPAAHSYGAELEMTWRGSSKLTLRGALGLLRVRIDRTAPGDELGDELERGPHLSGSAALDWNPLRRLQLSAQFRYRGGFFSDNFQTAELRVPAAATIGARAAYEIGRFTAFAYAHNLLDSFHLIYRYNSDYAEPEDPRVVGIGIEARF